MALLLALILFLHVIGALVFIPVDGVALQTKIRHGKHAGDAVGAAIREAGVNALATSVEFLSCSTAPPSRCYGRRSWTVERTSML